MTNKLLNRLFVLCLTIVSVIALSSCKKNLSSITGIKYDSETKTVSWDSSNAVETYNLAINGVKKLVNTKDTSYTISTEEMVAEDGSVDVTIEGTDSKGKIVEESTVEIVLLPDMVPEIKNGYFDWSTSINELKNYIDDGYTIKYKAVLNGVELTDLLTDSKYKIPTGSNEFRVKAVFTSSNMFYSNYSSVETKILAKPTNLNYDASMITWGNVDFFNSTVTYNVTVNDKVITTHKNYININEFFDSLDGVQTFTATVQAVSNDDGIISSEISDSFTYQYLSQVKNVRINNGTLIWDSLEGATKYQIEVDGNTLTDYFSTNEYTLGANTSKVVRVRGWSDADMTVAKWSTALTINILPSPTPSFNYESIVWSSVTNAKYYKVSLVKCDSDGNTIKTVLDSVPWESNMIDINEYTLETGIYKFSVCACPNDDNTSYFESSYSDILEIVRLGAPTRFRISETAPQKPNGEIMITLSGTNQGAKYTISLNNIVYGATNENSFTFNKPLESYNASIGDGYTTIKLTINTLASSTSPVNNKLYLDSNEVITLELRQLNTPDNLEFIHENDSDYVVWSEVKNAKGYGVLFSDAAKSSEDNKFAIPLLASGNYNVSVFAKGDILKDYNTINWSESDEASAQNYYKDVEVKEDMVIYLTSTYSTTLSIKKLQTPQNIALDSNNHVLTWDNVIDAKGYKINLSFGNNKKELYLAEESENGILKTNLATLEPELISDECISAGFVVEVIAIGNTSSETMNGETIVLDSEASTLKDGAIFHFLKSTTLSFSGVNLGWTPVAGATGYAINNVKRVDDNVPYVNYEWARTSATNFAWNDSNSIKAGKYKLCITVLGDYLNYFDSDYSNVLEFTKLKTPEVFHFDLNDRAYFILLEEGVKEYKLTISGVGTTEKEELIKVETERSKGNVVVIDNLEYLMYIPDFAGSDSPSITLQAIGSEEELYMASNVLSFVQKTRELNAPINPNVVGTFDKETKVLSISTSILNPFNKGYTFYFNNTEGVHSDTPSTTYKVGEYAEIEVKVGYEGEIFVNEDNEYIYYYSSQSSVNSSKIYCLANVTINKPSNNKGKFTFKFNSVTKGEYAYNYEVIDTKTQEVVTAKTNDNVDIGTANQFVIDLSTYLESDTDYTIRVYVYSVGTDDDTIISNPNPEVYEMEI